MTLNVTKKSLYENLKKQAESKSLSIEEFLSKELQESIEYIYDPEVAV